MKVLAICGSARPQGNTNLLLHEVLKALEQEGLETEYISLHDKQILPCRACMQCAKEKNRCAQEDDFMPVYEAMAAADGLLVGSPVYFGSATPNLMALLDRAGYVARQGDNPFYRKVGIPVVVARRAGVNFTYAQLQFWFVHHGHVYPGVDLLAHRLRPQTRRRGRRRRGDQDHAGPGPEYGVADEEVGVVCSKLTADLRRCIYSTSAFICGLNITPWPPGGVR